MQTNNTAHVQHCSVEGCMDIAEKTLAFGKYATSPKGLCCKHTVLDLPGHLTARKQELENNLLRDIGFVLVTA